MKTLLKASLITLALVPALFNMQAVTASSLPQSVAPKSADAYIISPKDGETVSETFTIRFGLKDMGVSPAGIEKKHTGHHHLLIDQKTLPPLDRPLGGMVTHFGGGQTETTITLPKGEHTLQLILGDHHHIPHNPAVVSKKITITVK
jgi:hypothetical protein